MYVLLPRLYSHIPLPTNIFRLHPIDLYYESGVPYWCIHIVRDISTRFFKAANKIYTNAWMGISMLTHIFLTYWIDLSGLNNETKQKCFVFYICLEIRLFLLNLRKKIKWKISAIIGIHSKMKMGKKRIRNISMKHVSSI